jgi:hypothetical protein
MTKGGARDGAGKRFQLNIRVSEKAWNQYQKLPCKFVNQWLENFEDNNKIQEESEETN